MKKILPLIAALVVLGSLANAQTGKDKDKDNTKPTKMEKIKETIQNLPEDLIKQPDAVADTNANKLVSDNLSMEINPIWKEKGTLSIIDYRLLKCDVDPLKATFPLPDKKLVQGLTINMNTTKKSAADKKAMVLADVQKHLAAFYKEAGKSVTKEELATQTNAMVVGSEPFTTNQGRSGDLYFIHDIQTQQAGFTVLLLLPGTAPAGLTFVYVNYFHYVYETTYPEDVLEWRTFIYPEDQLTYIDFTKKMLKTLVIK